MPPTRSPGQLQDDIVTVLTGEGKPMVTKDIHEQVAQKGATSEGAVRQALLKLVESGKVTLAASSPQTWALATGAAHATIAAPATPTAPAPRQMPVAPVARPSGQLYYPREFNGRPDVEVLRQLRDHGAPVLLYGPPGTGKTALAEAAHHDLITVAGDGDTTVADLVGEYTQKPDGTYEFVYGPLVKAMREGRSLLVDDATLIPPPVLATLYPAMDGRGQITIKAYKNELVTAAGGFYVLAGHNPGVAGAHLTEALRSRFSVHIEVTTDYDLAKKLKVPSPAVKIAKALDKKREKGECEWVPQMRELIAFREVASALGIEVAFDNLISVAPDEDRDTVAAVVSHVAAGQRKPLRLGAQIRTSTTTLGPSANTASTAGQQGGSTP